VFYNSNAGAQFELNHTQQSSFIFCSRNGMKSKSIDTQLIWKFDDLTATGLQLVQKLKDKKGLETPPNHPMGSWNTINEFSLTAFGCSSYPNNRIIPTIEGFIYFGTNGTLIVDQFSESYTSISRGKELLDQAILDSPSLQIKRQVGCTKVSRAPCNRIDKCPVCSAFLSQLNARGDEHRTFQTCWFG
jgi:hypothetical protein